MSDPPVRSFPVSEDVLAADEAADEIEEEIHRDEDVAIRVTQSPGYLCRIEATAAIRLPAEVLYHQLVTHPDNAAIFRHMDRCSYRRVLSDDGQGCRRVKVAHEASWRFLLFHGTFTTRLDVEEDDRQLSMSFSLDPAGGGIMKRFHGRWTIRPHPKDPQHASLSTLDQELALGVYLPPPLDRILKRISCTQVKHIFNDVKREAAKVNRGKPTLCPWREVRDKEIGTEQEGPGGSATAGVAAAAGDERQPAAVDAEPVPATAAVGEGEDSVPPAALERAAAAAAAEELAGLQLKPA